MSGIIRAPRPARDYFEVRNATARDRRLSYRARGLLLRLLSNEDGFRMTADDLAREGREGRGSVLTALKELRTYGYIVVQKVQGDEGRWRTETLVFDTAQSTSEENDKFKKPASGKPASGEPASGRPTSGKHAAIQNNQEKQQVEKTTTDVVVEGRHIDLFLKAAGNQAARLTTDDCALVAADIRGATAEQATWAGIAFRTTTSLTNPVGLARSLAKRASCGQIGRPAAVADVEAEKTAAVVSAKADQRYAALLAASAAAVQSKVLVEGSK